MSLSMRWVGEEDLDRVAEARWRAFGHAGKELAGYKSGIRADPRAAAGDYLLAERDGMGIATATALSMRMWVRGSPIACQGVAYVGTIKSGRRGSGATAGHAAVVGHHSGAASQIMQEVLRKAREREQPISALMPFRVSFYEHFGYGVVERRAEWTIPIHILPKGSCEGWQPLGGGNLQTVESARQHNVQIGQCDIERPPAAWAAARQVMDENGMIFVHQSGSYVHMVFQMVEGKSVMLVNEWGIGLGHSLEGLLCFLGSLADNYTAITIFFPWDWPVNRLLRERQVPHRPVTQPTANCRLMTRMQARVLDHRKFLESLHLPKEAKGSVTVAVQECEGGISRFRVEIEGGGASVKPDGSGTADLECRDYHWASIACGDLSASQAAAHGLVKENRAGAANVLDALAVGPLPFTFEYF